MIQLHWWITNLIKILQYQKDESSKSEFVLFAHADTPYRYKGCWKDSYPDRALEPAEGNSSFLDGDYPFRENATMKCFETARNWSRPIFAVQDGGQCFTEAPGQSYDKYGPSSDCKDDGEGGPMANDVFEIKNR